MVWEREGRLSDLGRLAEGQMPIRDDLHHAAQDRRGRATHVPCGLMLLPSGEPPHDPRFNHGHARKRRQGNAGAVALQHDALCVLKASEDLHPQRPPQGRSVFCRETPRLAAHRCLPHRLVTHHEQAGYGGWPQVVQVVVAAQMLVGQGMHEAEKVHHFLEEVRMFQTKVLVLGVRDRLLSCNISVQLGRADSTDVGCPERLLQEWA
mmetsp:Transcript_85372/g.198498  ORF Transcript_85372/g.198498 Transcript_85372/m.198498 type:complete len:207 (-) Transcript_85372:501-1121(-)